MPTLHKIVILGTGFGGIYALKSICKRLKGRAIHVTVIGRQNYFLFTPMLHEVATGVMSHHQAAVAVRELLPNTSAQYVMAEVQKVDRDAKLVHTDRGDIAYDTLIIATGAQTNYFGVEGAQEHALPFKTLKDALTFRHRMSENFEKALTEKDEAKRLALLSVVVIGGGPTGVEFSAELGAMIFKTFLRSSQGRLKKKDLRICLLHRGNAVVEMYPKTLQEQAIKALRKKGVEVCLGEEVVKIEAGRVMTKRGTVFSAEQVLWMAGVQADVPTITPALPINAAGRLVVDGTLRTEDHAIYALGDVAAMPVADGRGLPMLAQVAVQQGNYLGKALSARWAKQEPSPFKVHLLGELVSLGSGAAIGEVLGVGIRGPIASLMWKGVYLVKFVSMPKRLKILMDWFVGLFARRDMTIS